jgi:hypothetical protein
MMIKEQKAVLTADSRVVSVDNLDIVELEIWLFDKYRWKIRERL